MTRKQRRLILIGSSLGVLAFAVALILGSLRESIVFFNSPTDIADNKAAPGKRVRLGGMVKMGSLERGENLQVRFEVTDGNKDIPVSFQGIVPDLFREGQGVVAEGHVEPGGTFAADTVLAKHDENYMPREVVETLNELYGIRSKIVHAGETEVTDSQLAEIENICLRSLIAIAAGSAFEKMQTTKDLEGWFRDRMLGSESAALSQATPDSQPPIQEPKAHG